MPMNHGKKTESDVARLCGGLFLKDFVLESPKYRTPGGQLREAADALLPNGDSLIVMQVKTRVIPGSSLSDDGPELGRVLRRVKSAAEQVKTVLRAIDTQSLEEGKTLRGVSIPLSNRAYSDIHGVVVIDVFNSKDASIVDQLEIQNGIVWVRGIPVHIFRASDFRTIAQEQDTLPDLLNYLNVRKKLLARVTEVPLVTELDLFGLFKTRYPVIEECLSSQTNILLIEPGLWEKVHRDFPEMWTERDQRMNPSYLVDRTIEEVHTCIGYDLSSECPPNEVGKSGVPHGPSTPAEYWEILQRLGLLSRVERAQFGAKMYEKAEAADKKPFAYTMIYRPPDVGPIVYLCSNQSRHQRAERLRQLMKYACAYMGTSHAVGIATQSLSSIERSHDFCVMEDVFFDDPKEAKRLAQQAFGARRGTSLDEWGKDYAPGA